MRGKAPGEGEAVALCRSLRRDADPLAFYAALTDAGQCKDTMLFERTGGPTFLLEKAALRIECTGQEVSLTALTAGGRALIDTLTRLFAKCLVRIDTDRIRLSFPQAGGDAAEERLNAPSPFDAIRALTTGLVQRGAKEPYGILCLGVVAYDHVDLFETLPAAAEDPLKFPDFVFWLAESLILFEPGAKPRAICTAFGCGQPDRARQAYYAAAERLTSLVARAEAAPDLADPDGATREPDFTQVDLDDLAYEAVVVELKRHIAEGEVYQIVPSRTFRALCPDPFRAYEALRAVERSPYRFFVAGHSHLLFGASPETSVRVFERDGVKRVEVKPIAGTRPRGDSPDEDDRLEAEMRLDAKELAEHMMLVDLARNDVARISLPGSRRVEALMQVERYARVMHLVSSVTGTLRQGHDAAHALQACLNVGTLTGAPKIRATQLLRAAERTKRGPYGGAVGWISGGGLMDSAVVIRSALVKDGMAFVRAGAGIVHDSDPKAEADETKRKASVLLSVLAGAAS